MEQRLLLLLLLLTANTIGRLVAKPLVRVPPFHFHHPHFS